MARKFLLILAGVTAAVTTAALGSAIPTKRPVSTPQIAVATVTPTATPTATPTVVPSATPTAKPVVKAVTAAVTPKPTARPVVTAKPATAAPVAPSATPKPCEKSYITEVNESHSVAQKNWEEQHVAALEHIESEYPADDPDAEHQAKRDQLIQEENEDYVWNRAAIERDRVETLTNAGCWK